MWPFKKNGPEGPSPSGGGSAPGEPTENPEPGSLVRAGLRWSTRTRTPLSLGEIHRIRKDPQIFAGLQMVKLPVMSLKWDVGGGDGEAAGFVKTCIEGIWRPLVRQALSAVEFGHSAMEKIWESGEVSYRVPAERGDGLEERTRRGWFVRELRDYDPSLVELETPDPDGFEDYSGFRYLGVLVPPEKSFWFTFRKEFGNLYGAPLITEEVQRRWYDHEAIRRMLNRYIERTAFSPLLGRAPRGSSGGKENVDILYDALSSLKDNAVAVFPQEYDAKGNPLWTVEPLAAGGGAGVDQVLAYLRYLDESKLLSLFVPPRTVLPAADTGTYAEASQHTENFLSHIEALTAELLEHVNAYLVEDLVAYNFPPGTARPEVVAKPLRDEEEAFLRDCFKQALAARTAEVSLAKMAERYDVPLLPEEERKEIREAARRGMGSEASESAEADPNSSFVTRNSSLPAGVLPLKKKAPRLK